MAGSGSFSEKLSVLVRFGVTFGVTFALRFGSAETGLIVWRLATRSDLLSVEWIVVDSSPVLSGFFWVLWVFLVVV